jgi:hypothetical protein
MKHLVSLYYRGVSTGRSGGEMLRDVRGEKLVVNPMPSLCRDNGIRVICDVAPLVRSIGLERGGRETGTSRSPAAMVRTWLRT